MKITCWGARGSIPVSGKEYLNYGGDTTCIEIRTKDDDVIIIDAGTGMRKLGEQTARFEQTLYTPSLYPCPLGPPHGFSLF